MAIISWSIRNERLITHPADSGNDQVALAKHYHHGPVSDVFCGRVFTVDAENPKKLALEELLIYYKDLRHYEQANGIYNTKRDAIINFIENELANL